MTTKLQDQPYKIISIEWTIHNTFRTDGVIEKEVLKGCDLIYSYDIEYQKVDSDAGFVARWTIFADEYTMAKGESQTVEHAIYDIQEARIKLLMTNSLIAA